MDIGQNNREDIGGQETPDGPSSREGESQEQEVVRDSAAADAENILAAAGDGTAQPAPPVDQQPSAPQPPQQPAAPPPPPPAPPAQAAAQPAAPPPPPPPAAPLPAPPAGPPPPPARVGSAAMSGSEVHGAGKPPRKGRGCLIAVLLFCVVCLVVVVLAVLAFGSLTEAIHSAEDLGTTGNAKIREEVISSAKGGSGKKIAVIDIKGMIVSEATFDGAGSRVICTQLKAARKDSSVVAVILDMDTPGGGVTASDEIYRTVRKVSAAGKPVVTCMHALGASGGYMVAAGSDHIVANRLTLTGSVGVIIGTINYSGLFERFGLESETYKSGEMKDLLNGGRKRTEAERQFVDQLVMENFREFAKIVADGRERYASVEDVLNAEFADGRVLTGRQALEAGLVDELGYLDDAIKKARELARAPNAKVVRYRRALRLADVLFAVQSGRALGLRSILPVEAQQVKPGRAYFLLPSVLP